MKELEPINTTPTPEPARRVTFAQSLRRRPWEFYEAMHVGVFTALGGVAGAWAGYLNLADTMLKHGDVEKAIAEGIGMAAGGTIITGGAALGVTAYVRGWRSELEEGQKVEVSPVFMTPETKSYTRRFAARVTAIATALGLPIATVLTGVLVSLSGHTQTGDIVIMSGLFTTPISVTVGGFVPIFPSEKTKQNNHTTTPTENS